MAVPYRTSRSRRRRLWLVLGASGLLGLFFLPVTVTPAPTVVSVVPAVANTSTPITPATFPIDHIVVVMMENHAYDNYFGVYCQATSSLCPLTGDGIPAGTCVPYSLTNASLGCVKPYALNESYVYRSVGAGHNWMTSNISYDDGKMNGFLAAGQDKKSLVGYYNGSTIPTYWDLAEEYGLGDQFFSATLSYSLPNHWFLLAGQAPAKAETDWLFVTTNKKTGATEMTPADSVYLNEANNTPAIDDQLVNTSITWKYYDESFDNATYAQELTGTNLGLKGQGVPSVYNYWDPLAAKNQTYTPAFEPHWVNRGQFQADAAAGNLPNISWVIPDVGESDHPPANLSLGMQFVGSIINSVEQSPDWNSTAVFVTWDEYGGYYDNVAPPQLNPAGLGLGFRVPLLVVSPYTPEGYISNTTGSFVSLLHFMEWRYGLSALTPFDANSSIPLQYFDLNATPRAPINISFGQQYPLVQQPLALHPVTKLTGGLLPSGVQLSWKGEQGGSPVAAYEVEWHRRGAKATHEEVVPRQQSALAVTGLACDATYRFSVATIAGDSISTWKNVTLRTTVCGTGTVIAPGGPTSVFAAVAREQTIDPMRRPRGRLL